MSFWGNLKFNIGFSFKRKSDELSKADRLEAASLAQTIAAVENFAVESFDDDPKRQVFNEVYRLMTSQGYRCAMDYKHDSQLLKYHFNIVEWV